jgi:hypothetical protein
MTTQTCGHCHQQREIGDVCCVAQARNQGRLHATCTHEPPPMPSEWLSEYEAGIAEGIRDLEAAR